MLGQMLHPVRQDPGVTISPIDGFGFVIDPSPAEEAVWQVNKLLVNKFSYTFLI